eukprot:TRINITY_DN12675_c1_g2_i1.p1 TRINITY_DN12675_c1_g2~~TRINITY_DN12675_c1_g2_i1.p1  ORF type:complete len:1062 (+),score=302.20 TRINITY_DN12675_c1_g2_i1:64-3186(+)
MASPAAVGAAAGTAAPGELGLLVCEVIVRVQDLAGLDEPAELCAVDPGQSPWGPGWKQFLPEVPDVPQVPEEGGFVLRPLRAALGGVDWDPDRATRALRVPPKDVHRRSGFPRPKLVSNEVFIELRYSMAPSLLRHFEFDDLRDGLLRLFAVPRFGGGCRLLLAADPAAVGELLQREPPPLPGLAALHILGCAAASCLQLLGRLPPGGAKAAPPGLPARNQQTRQSARLRDFLHAAAALPPWAEWPSTGADSVCAAAPGPSGLFAHQERTVAWMLAVEAEGGGAAVSVEPVYFAGVPWGLSYTVPLPRGGCVAHPPGSGKTRIVGELARRCPGAIPTAVRCPAHLVAHWEAELAAVGAKAQVAAYGAEGLAEPGPEWRLVLDEPQDIPREHAEATQQLADAAGVVWVLCGTAHAHNDAVGRLVAGRQRWFRAVWADEWRGFPTQGWVQQRRWLRDPPWACLPLPAMTLREVGVSLSPTESTAAAVQGLSGFVIDGVIMCSFGADALRAVVGERRELLAAMGWEAAAEWDFGGFDEERDLSDWEAAVEGRTREKRARVAAELERAESEFAEAARGFLRTTGDSVPLDFLSHSPVRVTAGAAQVPAAAAEWNTARENAGRITPGVAVTGLLLQFDPNAATAEGGAAAAAGAVTPAGRIALCAPGVPGDRDWAAACRAAAAAGFAACIFVAGPDGPQGMGYAESACPSIPACMIPAAAESTLRAAEVVGVEVIPHDNTEDADDADAGMLTEAVAEDAVGDALQQRCGALRAELSALDSALAFAGRVRELLRDSEASCPICHDATAAGSPREGAPAARAVLAPLAVLPCCHTLCRLCLERIAGPLAEFLCPLCRREVERAEVTVFRRGEHAIEESPPGLPEGFDWRRLTTKQRRLLLLVREVLAEAEDERVVVFTQYVAHVEYLCALFAQAGIATLSLGGSLGEGMHALRTFGTTGAARVLVLSSQRHASGTNLQCARNVVIVHPFCTPTATGRHSIAHRHTLAYETQAVGRVRRFPQTRDVRVYRLYAEGTIEEELYSGRWAY